MRRLRRWDRPRSDRGIPDPGRKSLFFQRFLHGSAVELLFDHILTNFPATIWPGFPAAIRAGPFPAVRLSFDYILTNFPRSIPGDDDIIRIEMEPVSAGPPPEIIPRSRSENPFLSEDRNDAHGNRARNDEGDAGGVRIPAQGGKSRRKPARYLYRAFPWKAMGDTGSHTHAHTREGGEEREVQEKEKAGRNGISVLRRPTCA